MRRKVLMATLLLLACVVFGAMPGLAAPQVPVSDVLTVYNPDGSIFQRLTQVEIGENGQLNDYLNILGLADPAQFGNATTLCEALPCSSSSPISNFSDIFGVLRVNGNFYLGFSSDGDNGQGDVFGPFGAIFKLETPNVPVDATMYLDDFFRSRGYTATFVSDGDVPEPGSMVLLGTGVLGLAGVLRRKLMR